MNFNFVAGWKQNHDSKYSEDAIKTLIGQCRDLAAKADAKYMGDRLAAFVTDCLYGDVTIDITKGIHERWDSNNRDANPHIQVAFSHKFSRFGKAAYVKIHVCLSEKSIGTTWKRDGVTVANCEWTTVGMTAQRENQPSQNWPAQFSQEYSNIQSQDGLNKRSRKRRNSIGLIVPPEFKSVPQA